MCVESCGPHSFRICDSGLRSWMASPFPRELFESSVELADGLILLPTTHYLHHCYGKANLGWIFGTFSFGILFKLYHLTSACKESCWQFFFILSPSLGSEAWQPPRTCI